MNQPYLKHRLLGVNFTDGSAQILVWAPFAGEVVVHNESTGASIVLDKEMLGYWYARTDLIADDDLYRIAIDGAKPLPDPASLAQPFGVHGASQAVRLDAFPWTDEQWRNPDFGDYIIYELHPGTFSAEGNFDGIIRKLEHLRTLGINAIELMPVAQFPGRRNWGYDGVFPFAVQESYGGVMGLQQLVNTCHEQGFAVILDVVYNHLGPEGNYFGSYGPYFTDKYKTPWGSAINFDDEYCDPVRRFFIENALMWLRDFHIDTLRLDAVHAIMDHSPKHIIAEMNDAVTLYNAATHANKYLVLETDLNDSRFIQTPDKGGYGVRAQWCDEFHHTLRVATGQARSGYYADFDGLHDLAKSLKDAFVFTGQYSEGRHRNFGTPTTGITGDHFVVFAQNHDQVGNRMLGERIGTLVSTGLQRIMAAMVLTAPFVPMLFMGEEWGATTPFQYFIDHSEPELIKAVNEGRKREFASFQTEGEPAPAHEEATFMASKLDWAEVSSAAHAGMFGYYKQLIRLRRNQPALTNYDRSAVQVSADTGSGIIIVERTHEAQTIYCLYNFSPSTHDIKLNETAFPATVLLSSSDPRWQEEGHADDGLRVFYSDDIISLQPESVLILSKDHV